jgi:hypothetical protein
LLLSQLQLFTITEDVFDNKTLNLITKPTDYYFGEIITPFFGRCYTVCKLQNVSDENYETLTLSSNWNYKAFLHNQNEEIWLAGNGFFPTDNVAIILGKIIQI